MKTLHFYCSYHPADLGPYEEAQDSPISRTDCMLTPQMVDYVMSKCANGRPPFKTHIPRYIAWDAGRWAMKNPLLELNIIPGKPDDNLDPLDTAIIEFDDSIAIIHARRCLPCLPEPICT